MSYLNRIFAHGLAEFGREMRAMHIRHLIVPDLPVDSPLAQTLTGADTSPLTLIPVLAANVSAARLEKLLALGFDFFYLRADFKITGSTFSLHPRLTEVVEKIKACPPLASKRRIGIGFGISTPEQARLIVKTADVAIIGSALIQAQQQGRLEMYLESFQNALVPATEG